MAGLRCWRGDRRGFAPAKRRVGPSRRDLRNHANWLASAGGLRSGSQSRATPSARPIIASPPASSSRPRCSSGKSRCGRSCVDGDASAHGQELGSQLLQRRLRSLGCCLKVGFDSADRTAPQHPARHLSPTPLLCSRLRRSPILCQLCHQYRCLSASLLDDPSRHWHSFRRTRQLTPLHLLRHPPTAELPPRSAKPPHRVQSAPVFAIPCNYHLVCPNSFLRPPWYCTSVGYASSTRKDTGPTH